MLDVLKKYMQRPELYEESSDKFWDNEHISKGMLDAHLNPKLEAATRKIHFVQKSVDWIADMVPPNQFPKLLDLGCGPGIYANLFYRKGYFVTGVDFSKRSIDYAKKQARINNFIIMYHYQNYLYIDYLEEFDVITLIYCDFGVLSTHNRHELLGKIYKALKPGGKLIFDVFTLKEHENKSEYKCWEYNANGGFWSAESHLCLHSFYRYDEDNTVLNQYIITTDNNVQCYNVWEHCFSEESLISELKSAGFFRNELFGDIAGSVYKKDGNIICIVASK